MRSSPAAITNPALQTLVNRVKSLVHFQKKNGASKHKQILLLVIKARLSLEHDEGSESRTSNHNGKKKKQRPM